MGKADVQSKGYFDDKSVFADAFNYYVYEGDPVIKPEDLREVDSSELGIFEDRNIRPEEVRRDTIFEWTVMEDDFVTYVLFLGLEEQTHIHYAMPARCADYDAKRYMAQVRRRGRELRKLAKEKKVTLTTDERVSWFMKEDRIKPVVTLVLYLGKKPWDGPETLHKMLDVRDGRILKYIPDYKINLIDPHRMKKEDFSNFMTELGLILEITKNSRTWDDLSTMMREDERLKNVSREGVRLLRETIEFNLPEEEMVNGQGGYNVCGALEELRDISKQEGKLEFALDLIKKRMEKRGMTAREAAEELDLDPELADRCVKILAAGGDVDA